MAFIQPLDDLLARLDEASGRHLEDGWAAEPRAARLALLVRKELEDVVRETYPNSSRVLGTFDSESRRQLYLSIHTAGRTHDVVIWGISCDDERESAFPNLGDLSCSWLLLVHLGTPDCPILRAIASRLEATGLGFVEERLRGLLYLGLRMGPAVAKPIPPGTPASPR